MYHNHPSMCKVHIVNGHVVHVYWIDTVYVQNNLPATGLCSAVSNESRNRCESDCRSRGPEFDPGVVPYFRGDRS